MPHRAAEPDTVNIMVFVQPLCAVLCITSVRTLVDNFEHLQPFFAHTQVLHAHTMVGIIRASLVAGVVSSR